MPQKKNLEEPEDVHSEEEIQSHKKVKTTEDGNGTVDKNGKDEEIIDGVKTDEVANEEVEVKNGTRDTGNEKLGVLLICGGINWDLVGRKELPKAQRNIKNVSAVAKNFYGPNYWNTDIKLRSVHSSCGASHSVVVSDDYKAYVFGRNDKNQLGKF